LGRPRRTPADHARPSTELLRQPSIYYHLNAEGGAREPPPGLPEGTRKFKERFGPARGVKCKADGKGGQTIENTGA
jgi:hypothetical protein